MAGGDRKNADVALVTAMAGGATVEAAAKAAGMSERTAYRRLAEPGFAAELSRARTQMLDAAVGMAAAFATTAMRVLVELAVKGKSESVRLSAARAVLELGPRLRESVELAQQIQELREKVDGQIGTRDRRDHRAA